MLKWIFTMRLKRRGKNGWLVAIAVLSFAPIGCSESRDSSSKPSKKTSFSVEEFKTVKKGMTEDQVKELLGNPFETMQMQIFQGQRSYWRAGDQYFSISFADGKVEAPFGPMTKAECDKFKALMEDLLALAEGKQKEQTKNPSPPTGPKEAATTEDGRWILSLATEGFTLKGSPLQIGETSIAELGKIIGKPDRVVDLDLGGQLIEIWDNQGIRAYVSKRNGAVRYLDCCFEVGSHKLAQLDPQKPFLGVLKIEGEEITKTTTEKMLLDSGRIKSPIRHGSSGLPGFMIDFGQHSALFDHPKDREVLQMVRISQK